MVLFDGFYWGSYDGASTIVVYDPAWDVVDSIEVDVVDDFFDTYTFGYYTSGRYVVGLYDEWVDYVASTAFIVEP